MINLKLWQKSNSKKSKVVIKSICDKNQIVKEKTKKKTQCDNSNCDKSWKLKLWQNSNDDKAQKLKLCQYSKTKTVTTWNMTNLKLRRKHH